MPFKNPEDKKRYYEKNKERFSASKKEYTLKNKDRIARYLREYRDQNKEILRARAIEYNAENEEYQKSWRKNYYEKNQDDLRKRAKEYRNKNSEIMNEKQRGNQTRIDWRLKTKFGITLEDYNILLVKQNNVCAICLKPEREADPRYGKIKKLAVDHDHVTGKVRGLLCSSCNTSVGRLGDSIDKIKLVLQYLEKNQ